MDHQARQTTAVQPSASDDPGIGWRTGAPPEPRTWEVQEWIGNALVLLGTVEAVHHETARVRAMTQHRIFDTDRQDRIRIVVRR